MGSFALTTAVHATTTDRMELHELEADERVALVAILERVAGADRQVSRGEARQIRRVAEALGQREYEAALAEIDARLRDDDVLRAFLRSIARRPAQELIYETALDAAIPESIAPRESALLDWLAKEWRIVVRPAS